jgi:hypothetical protein
VSYSLVLRSIAVIWNKDIITDYIFRLDGTLEIRVSTTGYLQATFSLPRERSYGNTVSVFLSFSFNCLSLPAMRTSAHRIMKEKAWQAVVFYP